MLSLLKTPVLIAYVIIISSLSVYVFHAVLMVVLYKKSKRRVPRVWKGIDRFPVITVQLPVYNERYVIERLVDSVCAIDYPRDKLEVQVLDDSTDATTEIARGLTEKYSKLGHDIKLIHRDGRSGYKAGALKEGLDKSRGELIAIFDADFIPPRDFLKKALPYFEDRRVGAIQSRWGHLNEKYSFLTRGQALGLDAHFVIEQTARNRNGTFINFNGTGGIWRKTAILDAGNWQYDTLTEDLDLSYRAQLRGWKLLYLNELVCWGEIPTEINSLKTQQHRWAKGAIQTAKKLLPKVLRADLPLMAKFEAFIHLTNHLAYPLMLGIAICSLPLIVIRVTCADAKSYFQWVALFTLCAIGHPLFYAYAQKEIYDDWRKRLLYLPALFAWGLGTSVINTKAVLEGLFNVKSPFTRTPKYRIEGKDDTWRNKIYRSKPQLTTALELTLAGYTGLALAYSIMHSQFLIIPFLALLSFSFFYTGTLSLLHAVRR
jgi:cellulose synthase/poly-beta-1,6-N-acetylglucosamine synthase-like glycosyltransferase